MKIQKRKALKIDPVALKYWWSKGLSDHSIAEKLGVSQTGVSRARQRLTLEPNFLCHINGVEKPPVKIYERYIQKGRDYKKNHKESILKKNKEYASTKEYKKKRRDSEREKRAKIRASRAKQARTGEFDEVKPHQKTVILNGKQRIIEVQGHLRKKRENIKRYGLVFKE